MKYEETAEGHTEKKKAWNADIRCSVLPLHTSTAARTRALLQHVNWELFDHRPSRPDFAPSNYHLFTYVKNWYLSQCFNNNEQLIEGVKT
jgi:hypothetical protein